MPYRGTFDGKADSIRLLGTLADSGVWIGYDQKHKDLAYAIIQTIAFYSYWYSSLWRMPCLDTI
jgi:hypothetical protein